MFNRRQVQQQVSALCSYFRDALKDAKKLGFRLTQGLQDNRIEGYNACVIGIMIASWRNLPAKEGANVAQSKRQIKEIAERHGLSPDVLRAFEMGFEGDWPWGLDDLPENLDLNIAARAGAKMRKYIAPGI
jgi:hypothetical protein